MNDKELKLVVLFDTLMFLMQLHPAVYTAFQIQNSLSHLSTSHTQVPTSLPPISPFSTHPALFFRLRNGHG